jgi:hypothetical protein
MKGWELKPLAWVVLLALIALMVYVAFRILKRLNEPPPAES